MALKHPVQGVQMYITIEFWQKLRPAQAVNLREPEPFRRGYVLAVRSVAMPDSPLSTTTPHGRLTVRLSRNAAPVESEIAKS